MAVSGSDAEDALVVSKTISDSVVVSKKSCWTPINGLLDSFVDVVWETESDTESQSQPESISSCEARGGALVLARSTDSGPCEITVEFQQRLCHVRSICILSTARTCEIYSQQELSGDTEYVCTARAELQEADDVEDLADDVEYLVDNVEDLDDFSETPMGCKQVNHQKEVANEAVGENVAAGPFYEAEVELVNADAWAGIKIRLLSLQDKSRAEIKRIRVSAVIGPPASLTCGDEGGNNSNSSLLAMLVPSVLQIVRGMSGENRVVNGHTGQGSNLPEVMPGQSNQKELHGSDKSSEQLQASLQYTPAGEAQQPSGTGTSQQKTATPQEKEGEDFPNEMRFRLQRLEMICVRMESYLHMAFSKLDNRVSDLEEQIRAIHHEQSLARDPSELRDSIDQSSTPLPVSSPPADCSKPPSLLEAEGPAPPIELDSSRNLEAVASEQEENVESLSYPPDQSDSHAELNNSVPEQVPATIVPGKASVSLDDAWTSALAAFSVSALPEVAEDVTAVVNAACPAPDVDEGFPAADVDEACPDTDVDEACPATDVDEGCPTTDVDEACPATDIDEACIAAEQDEACGSSGMLDGIGDKPFSQSQEHDCLRLSDSAHSQSSLQSNMGLSAYLGCNLLEEGIALRLHNLEVGAESSMLLKGSAAGADLLEYSDLVVHILQVGAGSRSTLLDDSAAGGDLINYSDLVADQSGVEEIGQADGDNCLSSQGSDTQCFSDSLLIDCVDGGYLMCQSVPEKDSGSVEDGFDLVFLPGSEANSSPQTEAALEACVSLLDVDISDCVREAVEAADKIDPICADLLFV